MKLKETLAKILTALVTVKEGSVKKTTDQWGQFNLTDVSGYIVGVWIDYRYVVVRHGSKAFRVYNNASWTTIGNTQLTICYLTVIVGGYCVTQLLQCFQRFSHRSCLGVM